MVAKDGRRGGAGEFEKWAESGCVSEGCWWTITVAFGAVGARCTTEIDEGEEMMISDRWTRVVMSSVLAVGVSASLAGEAAGAFVEFGVRETRP